MNNLSLGTIAAVFIALIALATAVFHTSDPTVAQSLANLQQQVAQLSTHSGSLAGPEIPSPYLQWGGVNEWRSQVAIAATSSVICAYTNPVGTSTITFIGVNALSNGMGSQTFDISTSSSAFASSSPALVLAKSLSAGQTQVIWSGSVSSTSVRVLGEDVYSTAGDNPYILRPNETITVRIATGTPGTFANYASGDCVFGTLQL